MRIIFTVITILCWSTSMTGCKEQNSQIYYVANYGNDNFSGKSPEKAWKTIQKVNKTKFHSGDQILFKCEDTWYEELEITNSGNPTEYILYSNFGMGAKPKILGSQKIQSWERMGNNIWKSTNQISDPSLGVNHNGSIKAKHGYPGGAWFELNDNSIIWGHREKNISQKDNFHELEKEFDWGWLNENIYIYSVKDPNTSYSGLQVSQRQTCVRMPNNNPQEYIHIDGIEMKYSQSKGFYTGYPEYEVSGLKITNCHIGYIGIKGAASAYGLAVWHSDMLIENNEINDCGRRGIAYNTYQIENASFSNVVIIGNKFYNGYHTTSLDMSSQKVNKFQDFTFCNNIVYDEASNIIDEVEFFGSNSVFIEGNKSNFFNFKFYNNIIINSMSGAMKLADIDSLYIHYNTFYGANINRSAFASQLYLYGNNNAVFCLNNIFYGNKIASTGSCPAIYTSSQGETIWSARDNNIYYQEDDNQNLIYLNGIGCMKVNWYSFQQKSRWDKNSLNPKTIFFKNPPYDLSPIDDNSPQVGSAIPITDIQKDFYGNNRNQINPTIGAIEISN